MTGDERPLGALVDARLHLLSRQVLDDDDVPVTTADDLELATADGRDLPLTGDDEVVVTAILTGPSLLTRVFGGRAPRSHDSAVPWRDVAALTTVVNLAVTWESLDVTWPERWVRNRVVGRIPGGRHDPR